MSEEITKDHPRAKDSIRVLEDLEQRLHDLQDRIIQTHKDLTKGTIKKTANRAHVWASREDTKAHWDALVDFIAFVESIEDINKKCIPYYKQASTMLEQLQRTVESAMKRTKEPEA